MDRGGFVIDAEDMQKTYQSSTRALDGVSLKVRGGTVFALLGPNGAGKTTFVRIIATQLTPSGGSAKVLGHDVMKEARIVRRRIAVVPQEGRPHLLQTPFEHILTYLVCRGLDYGEARKRADAILASLNLTSYRNTICANLSGGLRQRVLIAMAMSSEADLLVLDEPTIGLDPVARLEVWNLVRKYVATGKTILLTTHYMDEAEQLADSLAIINKGKLVATGTPSEIKKRLDFTHSVTVKTVDEDLSGFEPFGRVSRAGTGTRVLTSQQGASDLASLCLKRGLEVSVRQVTLEDVYINEVGQPEPE
ncbi:MAG: ABC transporter ATP-binding protein [Thaumarchaeota archaeon]|nr:ABC transporter ATP-binding protein [Nitrososphaerota archaeon]